MLRNTMTLLVTLMMVLGLMPATLAAESDFPYEETLRPQAKETLPLDAWAMLPAITQASVSPDGQRLAITRAQNINGNYVIEIRAVDDLAAEPVRLGASRMEVRGFGWLNDEKLLVQFRQNIQDGADNYWRNNAAIVNADGSEEWEMIRIRGSGGGSKRARTAQSTNAGLLDSLINNPDEVLLLYDINGNRIPDVVHYNLNTGQTRTVVRGNSEVSGGFGTDWDGEVRVGTGYDPSSVTIKTYVRPKGSNEWQLLYANTARVGLEDFALLAFTKENPNEAYVRAHNGQDNTGIYLMDILSKELSECLFCPQGVDVGWERVALQLSKPDSYGKLLGFTYTNKHPERYYVDAEEAALFEAVADLFPDKYVRMVSRSYDDSAIVVWTRGDDDPGHLLLAERQA